MKALHSIRTLLCIATLAVPTLALAQTTVGGSGGYALRRAGEREFTLGGAGISNRDFDSSSGGVNFSVGYYTDENQAWVIRQSINYSNPENADRDWWGQTRLAYDFHLPTAGAIRPFVGANVGGVYGDGIRDTFAAGIEAGAKFYVQPRTFVYAMAEYGWFFRHARSIDNRFRDGAFTWGVGLGFNF